MFLLCFVLMQSSGAPCCGCVLLMLFHVVVLFVVCVLLYVFVFFAVFFVLLLCGLYFCSACVFLMCLCVVAVFLYFCIVVLWLC